MTTAARLAEAERHLTGIARKVLEATPISEPWSAKEIGVELFRRGTRNDPVLVTGCLNNLKDDGLVKEPSRGMFQRVHAAPPLKIAEPPLEPTMPIENKSVVDEIATLSQQLRKLADALDAAALKVAEQAERVHQDTAKLEQLRTLLRGLT